MDEIRGKIASVLRSLGSELYDIELDKNKNKTILRIYVYREGGVDLDLCTDAFNVISPFLDVELKDMGEYTLEVSSPGLERVLRTQDHFRMSKGELVRADLGNKAKIEGVLVDHDNEHIVLESNGEKAEIELCKCKKIMTIFKWDS